MKSVQRLGFGIAAGLFVVFLFGSGAGSGKDETGPTFNRDVAPIMFKNCVTCHRTGEIAPMSLMTYKEIRPWARAIREKVISREMPPWHADSQHGEWSNDRRISRERD